MKKLADLLRIVVVLGGLPAILWGQEVEPAPEIVLSLASAPNVELSPSNRLDVGPLHEGGSTSLDLIIRNTGTAPLTQISVLLPDISPIIRQGQIRPFVITTSLRYPYILEPGAQATVTITANDSASHPLLTRLTVSCDDADEPLTTYYFQARPTSPELLITYQGRSVLPADLDLGTVKVGESTTRTFLLENPGLQPVDVEVRFEEYHSMEVINMSLLSPADGVFTLPPGGTRDLTVEFRPLAADRHAREIAIDSNAHHWHSSSLTIRGESYTDVPAFSYRFPARFMVQGDWDGIPAHAQGDAVIGYEWTKNGKSFQNPSPEQSALSFSPVKLSDAGIYQVRATNDAGSVRSTDFPIFVTSDLPPQYYSHRGSPATIKTALHLPPDCTLVESYWNHETTGSVTRISDGPLYRGSQTKTLIVRATTEATVGGYRCKYKVKLPSGEIVEGESDWTYLETAKAPEFFSPRDSMSLTVGDPVYVRVGELAANHPTSFAAHGLPPGVTLHPTTGLLSGRATAPRFVNGQPASYTTRLSARNGYGVTGMILDIIVHPRDDFLIGSFTGLIQRNAAVNDDLGGALQVNLTRFGSYSGRLLLGGQTYPIGGVLDWFRTAELTITRPAPLPSLLLRFFFSSQDPGKLVGHVKIAGSNTSSDIAELDMVRVLTGNARAANAFDGYFTAALEHSISIEDPPAPGGYPKGQGLISLTVRPNGNLAWTGRLADGTAVTGSSAVAEGGPLSRALRGNRQSSRMVCDH